MINIFRLSGSALRIHSNSIYTFRWCRRGRLGLCAKRRRRVGPSQPCYECGCFFKAMLLVAAEILGVQGSPANVQLCTHRPHHARNGAMGGDGTRRSGQGVGGARGSGEGCGTRTPRRRACRGAVLLPALGRVRLQTDVRAPDHHCDVVHDDGVLWLPDQPKVEGGHGAPEKKRAHDHAG